MANYRDTAEGAIEYLRDESSLDLDGATAQPDPYIQGVWKVTLRDRTYAIVYLAGYKDPFGKVRAHNDFEVSECDCPDCNEEEK